MDNGKIVPNLNLEDLKIKVDMDDVEVTISDSIVAWACDIFIYFFKGLILPGIIKDIQGQITPIFNQEMNQFMRSTKGLLDTGILDAGFDFSYSSHPEISEEHLQLFLNGTIFDTLNGEYVPSQGFASMDVDLNTTESVQIGLSKQMLDSAMYFSHNKDIMDLTITPDMVPAGLGVNMTTTYFEQYLKGLEARYGKDEPVNLRIATYTPPTTVVKKDVLGSHAQFDLHLQCKGEEAIVFRVVKGMMTFDVKFDNFTISL
jgi:hypothetical protein